ncbi:unnamed protein product [Acanthosepion pharaonis]|uniref:Uncharacterized protein n=1 Tax=Acanthosepion pharaonis TaxID=158019 RepID=A0A812EC37_ACAPH|nr:unnamed protein product [Sepia pharaonis]
MSKLKTADPDPQIPSLSPSTSPLSLSLSLSDVFLFPLSLYSVCLLFISFILPFSFSFIYLPLSTFMSLPLSYSLQLSISFPSISYYHSLSLSFYLSLPPLFSLSCTVLYVFGISLHLDTYVTLEIIEKFKKNTIYNKEKKCPLFFHAFCSFFFFTSFSHFLCYKIRCILYMKISFPPRSLEFLCLCNCILYFIAV